MLPRELFEKMLSFYGPQNWWPGEGFEIAIGAILTQNTSWKNVEKAIENLREQNLLTPRGILDCDSDMLLKMITPAGFYNQKARYLKNISRLMISNSKPSRQALLSVKGVGEETADSILLYLFKEAEFVIDAYTIRISKRLGFGASDNRNYWKSFYESSLNKEVSLFNEFHALFVEHGKRFCKKEKPQCTNCFLAIDCEFGKKESNRG
ncbi:MAG: endonuclease [Candidatus Heimdallarchaeota archaeon]|nr:endonuclease [Candidatus Heimdallarchaeota archaeon]MBY8993219.1 endonuclease [Candidatus Heimdallarchaeota archaeon]